MSLTGRRGQPDEPGDMIRRVDTLTGFMQAT